MSTDVVVRPLLDLPVDDVQTYWQTLYMHDKLQDRLFDIKEPTWSDVKELIVKKGAFMMCVVDPDSGQVLGEFQLAAAIGNVAQLHFSLHPEIPLPEKVGIVAKISHHILQSTPKISSLLGLTPYEHAKLVLKKAGWEYWGTLRGGLPTWSGNKNMLVMTYQE